MFDPEQLARAGVQARSDGYADWRGSQPYRIHSRRRWHDWSYKSAESVRLILLSKNATT